MADALKVVAQKRDPAKNKGTGSRVARRLRAAGQVPAIVYGHKLPPVPISISRDDVLLMLKKHSHLTELEIDGARETAVVKDVQWDHLGKEIIHLDFFRVSADERIETEVPIVTHGEAVGTKQGGVLEIVMHDLRVSCPAGSIPDEIRVDIDGVGLNQGIHVKELTLPAGVTTKVDPDQLVLHVVLRTEKEETTEGTTAEPELIRRPEAKEKEES